MSKYVIGDYRVVADKIFYICEDVLYAELKDTNNPKNTKIIYLDNDSAFDVLEIKKDNDMKLLKSYIIANISEDSDEDTSILCSVSMQYFKKDKKSTLTVCPQFAENEFILFEFSGYKDDISTDSSIAVYGNKNKPSKEIESLYNKIDARVKELFDECYG